MSSDIHYHTCHKYIKTTIAFFEIKTPKTVNELQFFLGNVRHLSKIILTLVQLCYLLHKENRLSCEKNIKHIWNILRIILKLANATEITHFNPNLEARRKCDASHSGLDAA